MNKYWSFLVQKHKLYASHVQMNNGEIDHYRYDNICIIQ